VTVADANVLIALLNPHDAHHERAVELTGTGDEINVHPLTMAEVLAGYPDAVQRAATFDALVEAGFSDPGIPYDEEVNLLAGVRVDDRLKMPDACVLATAIWRREPLLTFDNKVAAAARKRAIAVHTHE
jgi:predicted nucleic acid-binding protein